MLPEHFLDHFSKSAFRPKSIFCIYAVHPESIVFIRFSTKCEIIHGADIIGLDKVLVFCRYSFVLLGAAAASIGAVEAAANRCAAPESAAAAAAVAAAMAAAFVAPSGT